MSSRGSLSKSVIPMPVEIREIVIKTKIESAANNTKPISERHIAELKEQLLAELDKRINRQVKRDSFNR